MTARIRMTHSIVIAAVASLGLVSCDLSQKKPETVAAKLATGAWARPAAAGAPPQHSGAPAGADGESAGDRSMRLYGPGVSRERQKRI